MEQSRSSGKLMAGIAATLMANVILVTVNFTVKENPIYGGELCLVKGGLQIVIFGLLLLIQSREDFPTETAIRLHVAGFGLTVGILTLACYVAVQLVPVSDLIVICFTSPIFTIFISACMLKTSITATKISLCLVLIVGVALVVKPQMIFQAFNEDQAELRSYNGTQRGQLGDDVDETGDAMRYAFGLLASAVAAITGALINVQVAKCRKCPSNILMISGGIGTILVSFLCPLIQIPNRIFEDLWSIPVHSWMLIFGVSVGSIAAGLLLVFANKWATPTIVVMFRSTELLLALIGEWVIFSVDPEILGCVGSVLVLGSVIAMPWADQIQQKLGQCCTKTDPVVEMKDLGEFGTELLPKVGVA